MRSYDSPIRGPVSGSWEPTRRAGLERLEDFVPRAGREYAQSRNYDLGSPGDNVSGLSPYVRRRLLSEVEIARAVLEQHCADAADKFLQEVFWRTYWRGWLYLRPAVWFDYRADVGLALVRLASDDGDLGTRHQQAIESSTGIECFDFWARQLRQEGYLHNHARMWFASIWIYTLRLPWQLGAEHFAHHLLDADPASNTLSWRWVAGLHTPGKHYLARGSNIRKYTRGRFDPRGQLDESASPLEDSRVYSARSMPNQPRGLCESVAWLLTDDDLLGPSAPLVERPEAIAILAPDERQAESASSFARGARRDTVGRLEEGTGHQVTIVSSDEIVEWAGSAGVDQVAVVDPGYGETRARLVELEGGLRRRGIELVLLLRPWEQTLFPFASAGYFKFKKQLPRLLESLQPR